MDKDNSLLLTRHIKPDYGFYVQNDDRLSCTAFSSVASLVVRFSGYYITTRGEVNQFAVDVAPTSDRAVTSQIINLGECFILSCTATLVSGNANRGQCYVRARIQRNTGAAVLPIVRLLAGYLTDDYTPSFPPGRIEGPLDGPGMIRSIAGSDPAAGSEVSETVPTGARWRLLALTAVLVTDATVANRRVRIVIDDGTTTLYFGVVASNHTAGLTWRYTFAAVGTDVGNRLAEQLTVIPPNIFLPAGYRISTSTSAIVAGDNWGAPQLWVEEWIEA